MASEYALPPNAFLEPDNPLSVFPQVKKPQILDFRCHKIAGGGQAAIGVTRKHLPTATKKSKYSTIVKTAEQIAAEEAEADANVVTVGMDDEADEPVTVKSEKATKDTMMELAALTEKLSLDKQQKKKRGGKKADDDMMDVDGGDAKVPKIQIKSKAISKKKD